MTGAFDFNPDRFLDPAAPADVVPLRQIPKEWAHGLQLLADRVLPAGVPQDRWAQVVADAVSLATRYADQVVAAGWDMANLFGFDPAEPTGRVGLAVRMRGRLLVSIDSAEAVLKAGPRSYVAHRPLLAPNAPLLWTFREARGSR